MSQNMLSLLMQGVSSSPPTYSDDVFSAYTYTGNGSTQTITNGIDLAGKGGLVWLKDRTSTGQQNLWNTDKGAGWAHYTNTTGAYQNWAPNGLTAFNSNGFSIAGGDGDHNLSGRNYVSWTFRKAAKFFDIVTWTGTGTSSRSMTHSLGVTPGMIIVKKTNAVGSWYVYHRSIGNTSAIYLEQTAASDAHASYWNNTSPTATTFNLGSNLDANGDTYVAYLFAHDTATDGLIQCGSYTDGFSPVDVTLGWEPQFLLTKQSSNSNDWVTTDSSRAFTATVNSNATLRPNTSQTESVGASAPGTLTATGFRTSGVGTQTYVYVAIRRPNKPPTLGTQVYNAIARTGTGATATVTGVGFAPDAVWSQVRNIVNNGCVIFDRLRGANNMERTSTAAAEYTGATNALTAFGMDGYTVGADSTLFSINYSASGETYANWCFKRAPGVFDVVCYTGTGVATTFSHELGVAPELLISKNRSGTGTRWYVYHATLGATKFLGLNETSTPTTAPAAWNDTAPTSSIFTVDSGDTGTTDTHVAYLFATKAGISKVGSYTGDGTSGQTINCGFTTGARFVLIKRTDSTGDWFVWDSTRGIAAGNDPHLSLNTTAAEVTTDDSVDTDNSGFVVNQVAATNVNVNTATYIYLAFA